MVHLHIQHKIFLLQKDSTGRKDTYTHRYKKLSHLKLPKTETHQHFQLNFQLACQRLDHSPYSPPTTTLLPPTPHPLSFVAREIGNFSSLSYF